MDITSSPPGGEAQQQKFSWSKHARKIFDQSRLLNLIELNALTDVKLIAASGVEIHAHRIILSLASEYFWGLFVKEKLQTEVKVAGIDPQALESIIKFIYTGRIEISDDERGDEYCEKLYLAGELLDVRLVQLRTLQYMMLNINLGNCGRRLTFARSENCEELADATINFINVHYADVLTSRSFLQLDVSEVVAVLHCQGRLDTPEENVFTAVVKWLKKDEKERKKHSATLLREIDLSILPEDFLQFHFDTESVLHTFDSLQLYKKVLRSDQSEIQRGGNSSRLIEDPIYLVPQTSPRKTPAPTTILSPIWPSSSKSDKRLSKDGEEIGGASKVKVSPVHDLETNKGESKACSAQPKLKMVARKRTGGQPHHYTLAAGSTSGLTNAEVVLQKKSSHPSQVTTKLPELNKKRKKEDIHSDDQAPRPTSSSSRLCSRPSTSTGERESTSVHGNDSRVLKSAKRCKMTETNHVQHQSSQVVVFLRQHNNDAHVMMHDLSRNMTQSKKLGAIYKNNKSCTLIWASVVKRLYALGGVTSLKEEIASSKEIKFSTQSAMMQARGRRLWQSGPSMNQERNNFQAVILNNYMYAFGGSEGILGNQAVNCAERLNLTLNKSWEEIDYLQRARQGFGATALNGKIYVVGGYGACDGSSVAKMGILNTVEVYDPAKDEWTFVSSMENERHGLSVVAFKSKIYAIGGGGPKSHISFQEDIPCMKSVEVYDPATDLWEPIASMNRPRKNGCAVVLNGTIYAIGGDHSKGEDIVESSVEKYNIEKNKWTLVSKCLDKEGNFESVAVMDLAQHKDSSDDSSSMSE